MKKNVIGILVIFALIFSATCLIQDSVAKGQGSNSTDIQTVSKHGVILKYPSDWTVSKAKSNCSIVAISKISSIDSGEVGQVNINIEKKPIEDGSFEKFFNTTYNSLEKDSSYNLTSSGKVAIGDGEGYECVYTSNQNGILKEHKAIWIQKGDNVYVVLYSAPVDQFEENMKVLDYVMENLQINA